MMHTHTHTHKHTLSSSNNDLNVSVQNEFCVKSLNLQPQTFTSWNGLSLMSIMFGASSSSP